MIEREQRPAHWRETVAMMRAMMTAIIGGIVLLGLSTGLLNAFTVLNFPLGFYAVAQGALIACIIAAYWFANHQERLDRKRGAMEDM